MHEGEGAAVEAETRQGQLGDVMDIGFVIDQQDFPWCELGRGGREEGHGRFRYRWARVSCQANFILNIKK